MGTQTLTITDTTPNAVIYYTTDGSTPNTGSTVYGDSISISSSETVSAIAVARGYSTSTVMSATYTLGVTPTAPSIPWTVPQPITYGTPLSAAQLDASANVPGSFNYSPASGSVLKTGANTLTVTFTPTDTVDYSTAIADVTLNVNRAPMTVIANNQSMLYGGPLPTLTGTLTGVVAGDGITASYSTTATASAAAGIYPITATLNDPNAKLSNYAVIKYSGSAHRQRNHVDHHMDRSGRDRLWHSFEQYATGRVGQRSRHIRLLARRRNRT